MTLGEIAFDEEDIVKFFADQKRESTLARNKQMEEFNGNSRDMDWILTGWLSECENIGSLDLHILATELHNIIDLQGFKIVKK